MPKNILLLHTDQQRWDSLGCYGNPVAQTPHLDRLARQGARFTHHYASNPVCMPSRASLLTGRHLPAHGVIDNGIPLDTSELTMADALAEQGYDTYAAGKLHLTPFRAPARGAYGESFAAWEQGLFRDWDGPYYGFRRVSLVTGHGEGAAQPHLAHYGRWVAENYPQIFDLLGADNAPGPKFPGTYRSQMPVEAHHSTYVADRIIEYLEHYVGRQPFLLFAGFPDPHSPFTPPESYARRFDGADFPEPRFQEGENEGRPAFYARLHQERLFPTDGGAFRRPEGEHLHHIIQNTYAMVSLIDDNVGRILDALERLGFANETIVCFTSDHGELLGDHGLLHKGQIPYASLMRVPFVVQTPGLKPSVISAPMGNADVMPTLMELAGARVPETVQGQSYAPVIRGRRQRIRDAAFSCGWSKASTDFRHMSLHSDQWRITWWPGLREGELYDLNKDPDEFNNLFRSPAYRELRDRLLENLLHTYAQAGPLEPHVLCPW